jgi:hypothetical protein
MANFPPNFKKKMDITDADSATTAVRRCIYRYFEYTGQKGYSVSTMFNWHIIPKGVSIPVWIDTKEMLAVHCGILDELDRMVRHLTRDKICCNQWWKVHVNVVAKGTTRIEFSFTVLDDKLVKDIRTEYGFTSCCSSKVIPNQADEDDTALICNECGRLVGYQEETTTDFSKRLAKGISE